MPLATRRRYARHVSKAFTSEEPPDPGPLGRTPPRLAPGEVRYVTPEGLAALRAALHAARADPAPAAQARAVLLEATLATLTVLTSDAPPGEAAFGRWVTVEDEAAAGVGLLGVSAPLARALLGRRAGDQVEVERPGGARSLTVLAVWLEAPGAGAPQQDGAAPPHFR